MWVRSYSWHDQVGYCYNSYQSVICFSNVGCVYFVKMEIPSSFPPSVLGWDVLSVDLKNSQVRVTNTNQSLGFSLHTVGNTKSLGVPYWFISVVFALLCGLPWYRRRFNFSLRTFFIAFTVLAVLLGFIGWLIR
jgi:hypothetical protein